MNTTSVTVTVSAPNEFRASEDERRDSALGDLKESCGNMWRTHLIGHHPAKYLRIIASGLTSSPSRPFRCQK